MNVNNLLNINLLSSLSYTVLKGPLGVNYPTLKKKVRTQTTAY
jgi:hypothetical protein